MGLAHQPRPLVRAAVHQHAHGAVGVAHHDQRLAGDVGRVVVTGIRNLALVADVVPAAQEQALAFKLEQRLAQVHVPMHPVVLHQRADRAGIVPVVCHDDTPCTSGLATKRHVACPSMAAHAVSSTCTGRSSTTAAIVRNIPAIGAHTGWLDGP
ncbi:hypothetical protein D9M72_553660 [compost metagenome]